MCEKNKKQIIKEVGLKIKINKQYKKLSRNKKNMNKKVKH